jgi:hypothetical protein
MTYNLRPSVMGGVCEENRKLLKVAEKKRQERDLSPGARPSIITTNLLYRLTPVRGASTGVVVYSITQNLCFIFDTFWEPVEYIKVESV